MNTIDYEEEYFRLIKYYQDNPISKKDQYCETHHIIPRSCGGYDDKSNLVNLPADIHYKVHCYLPFVFKNSGFEVEYHKMVYAWKRLLNSTDEKLILMNIDRNAIEYRLLREEHSNIISKTMSELQSGSKNSNYGKHWYYNPETKEENTFADNETIPDGWIKGKYISEELHKQMIKINRKLGKERTGYIKWFYNQELDKYRSFDIRKEIPIGWIRKSIPMSESGKQKLKAFYQKRRDENKDKQYSKYKSMFDIYINQGFDEMCKQFDYHYSRANICQLFRYYVPEYKQLKRHK